MMFVCSPLSRWRWWVWEIGSEGGSVAVSGVPVVPGVGETSPSVVTVMCEGVPSDS